MQPHLGLAFFGYEGRDSKNWMLQSGGLQLDSGLTESTP